MVAFEVSGRIGSGKAVPALEEVIGTKNDYYLIREEVKAHNGTGGPDNPSPSLPPGFFTSR